MSNTIVVVEDDSSIREMLRYYFQSTGHEVRAYESGEDFLHPRPASPPPPSTCWILCCPVWMDWKSSAACAPT